MAWAIPALLKAVPVQTAQMGAGGRVLVDRSLGVTKGRNLLEAVAHNGALPGLQLVDRADLAGRHVLGDYKQTPVEQYLAAHTAGRGFDLVYDTVGGAVLDASFGAVARFGHVVSALGWGTHALAPLSFRAASYSGVFTLLPLLTGEGRTHHGDILCKATKLIERGKIVPRLDPRHFSLETIEQAHAATENGIAAGKIVVDVAT